MRIASPIQWLCTSASHSLCIKNTKTNTNTKHKCKHKIQIHTYEAGVILERCGTSRVRVTRVFCGALWETRLRLVDTMGKYCTDPVHPL